MQVLVKKLDENAHLPSRGSEYAAGYDLYALLEEPCQIPPHQTRMVGTGLSMAIPEGYFGGIFARSGLASKKGLRPANCVGVVDADYRGEIMVAVHNDMEETRMINDGERIAQLVILPFLSAEFEETSQLDDTVRGTGGFGSTDRKE